jgi:hypothetical protein
MTVLTSGLQQGERPLKEFIIYSPLHSDEKGLHDSARCADRIPARVRRLKLPFSGASYATMWIQLRVFQKKIQQGEICNRKGK